MIVDLDNPTLTLALKNSLLEINDKQLLSEPLGLTLRYQEYRYLRFSFFFPDHCLCFSSELNRKEKRKGFFSR